MTPDSRPGGTVRGTSLTLTEDTNVAIGPVQLIVLGFERPEFHGEILAEFQRLRDNDIVRVIDALVVYKDAEGSVAAVDVSQLNTDERAEFGATVGALIGFGAADEEGAELGAMVGAEAAMEGSILPVGDMIDVLGEIPAESGAAIILVEHRWAIPLRTAIANTNGYLVSANWISQLDLFEIGLATRADVDAELAFAARAEEAKSRETAPVTV
jgi:uncharacterized membrane protein